MGWINGLFAGGGVIAGIIWVVFLGIPIPFVSDSYIDQHTELALLRAAAAGNAEAVDTSEANRKTEALAAIAGVEGERQSCQDRLDAQRRAYERALELLGSGGESVEPISCDSRPVRPIASVYGDPE